MTDTASILCKHILSRQGNQAEIIPLFHHADMLKFTVHNTFIYPYIEKDDIIISVCRSGHMKWQFSEETCILLGQGDFCVHTASAKGTMEFSRSAYEGFLLVLEKGFLTEEVSDFFTGSDITPESIKEKFFPCTMIPGNEYTDRIFSAFHHQEDSLQNPYRKLKTLELLLHIHKECTSVKNVTESHSEQLEIIRNVHDYLLEHIDTHITIDMLAKQFLMNPTTLKQMFKEVYGTSLAAHIKEHRMEEAARLLKETNDTLAQIAKAVGYDSQSKFTAAFKNWYHVLPSSFRRQSAD